MTPLCWLKQTHLFRHNSYFQVIMRRVFCFTASDSRHGGSHGGYNPGPMGNPAGDFCCSAGDEFADATAPCCSGALEDEASATDLTARLGVSQPCCPTTAWEHGSQLWHLSGSPSLPEIPPESCGPTSLLLLNSCEKRTYMILPSGAAALGTLPSIFGWVVVMVLKAKQ